MKRFVFPLLIFVLAACTVAPQETATPSAAAWTATTAATMTATPEPTATLTSTPTATPAPLVLPVTNGTPLPDLPYEVITAENIARLRQIARYGYPRLLDANPYRLTADGRTLVVGTTSGLEFYDAQTQEKTGGFEVEFLRSFDMTPDGLYLLTFAGETLTVWTRDGQKVRQFDLEIGDAWELNPVALSSDGALIAVQRVNADWQEADKVDVYRVADGSLLDTVRGNGVVFSADFLATVFDGSVRLYPVTELGQGWETRLPKQSLPWCGASEGVSCGLTFSSDGTLAAVIRPARVDVYFVSERRLVRQVNGWETDRYSDLPLVQFASGQMLITTPALYDGQGEVKVPTRAIVVDIASGEWLNESEVQNEFAYWDGGQVRGFAWKAEAEMPYFWRPDVSVNDDGQMIVRELLFDGEYAICVNQDCVRALSDPDGKYELKRDANRFNIVEKDTGDILVSSSASQDTFIRFQVFPSSAGDVVFVETSRGVSANTVAYRADGRRAEIARDFVMKILPAGNKIAFSVFGEGTKVLDVEQWSVKGFAGEELLYFSGDKAYIADDDAVQVVEMSGKSEYIPVPGWRMGSTWQESGFAVAESAEKTENLFLVSTGGVIYAIDLDKKELIGQIKTIAPYSNAAMKFSQDNRFLLTFGMDGFIHIWAVVSENIP